MDFSNIFDFKSDIDNMFNEPTSTTPMCNIMLNEKQKYIKKKDTTNSLQSIGLGVATYTGFLICFLSFNTVLLSFTSALYSYFNHNLFSVIAIGIMSVLFLISTILAYWQYTSSQDKLNDISSTDCATRQNFDEPNIILLKK